MRNRIVMLIMLSILSSSVSSQDYRFSCSPTIEKIFEKYLKYDEVSSNRKKDLQDARVVTIDNKRALKKIYEYNTKVFYLWLIMRRVRLTSNLQKLDSLQFLIIDSEKFPIVENNFLFPENLEFLSYRSLKGNDSIPGFIYNCKKLKGFNFYAKTTNVINNRIDELKQLEHFILYVETLDSIPQDLCKLVNLCDLTISSDKENDLVNLPSNFIKLKKLKSLYIPIDLSQNIDFLYGMEIIELKVSQCTKPEIINSTMFPKLKKLIIDKISKEDLSILQENLPDVRVCEGKCKKKGLMYD